MGDFILNSRMKKQYFPFAIYIFSIFDIASDINGIYVLYLTKPLNKVRWPSALHEVNPLVASPWSYVALIYFPTFWKCDQIIFFAVSLVCINFLTYSSGMSNIRFLFFRTKIGSMDEQKNVKNTLISTTKS